MTGDGESSSFDIDIDELASSMRRKLNYYWTLDENPETGTKLCLIYKVPQHIRNVDGTAYKPIIVSIGPYHHGSPSLTVMEKEKWNCLNYILYLNRERRLRDYLSAVRGLVKQVRNCYTEETKMVSEKFLRMLLLDGCFILVSLYGTEGIALPSAEESGGSPGCQEIVEEDRIEERGLSQVNHSQQAPENSDSMGEWYSSFLAHDVFLLENQIPFFVVKRIHELLAGKEMMNASLANRIASFVERLLHYYPKAIQECDRPKDFHHLLHLCHMYFRPSQRMEEDHPFHEKHGYLHRFLSLGRKYFKLTRQPPEDEQNSSLNKQSDYSQASKKRWRRAVQYYEAGLEFKRKEFDKFNAHSLLDITFCKNEVEIPCLPIDENTGSLFRNLIAFEQTCPEFGNDVTAYIVCLSQLVSMPEDVALLCQRGIIVHLRRSDKAVSTLLAKLSKDVVFDFNCYYYLKSVHHMLERHYQSHLNRWMAWLRHNRFSNPWLALATLAAVFVLSCTIIQLLITVFSYLDS